jgi:hypothetical protein
MAPSQQRIAFLSSTALQVRGIADGAPADVAGSLRLMASELDVDCRRVFRPALPPSGR